MATPRWTRRHLRVAPERREALLQTGFLRDVRRRTVQGMRGKASAALSTWCCGRAVFLFTVDFLRGRQHDYQRETPPWAASQLCDWKVTCAVRHSSNAGSGQVDRYSILDSLDSTLCLAEGDEGSKMASVSTQCNRITWRPCATNICFVGLPSYHCHLSSPILSEPCDFPFLKTSTSSIIYSGTL